MTPRSALQPVPVLDGRGSLCREVLESLPAWFGIPEAIESYVAAAANLPMMACFDAADRAVGFVSVKTHRPPPPKSMSWASNPPGVATGSAAF